MEVEKYSLEMMEDNTSSNRVLYFYNPNPIVINNRQYLNSHVAIIFDGEGRKHTDAYAETSGDFINRKGELETSSWSEFKISKKTFNAFMEIYEKEKRCFHAKRH